MKRLFVVGCSGHGKVAADIAVKGGNYEQICFLDDHPNRDFCMEFPVVGDSGYAQILPEDEVFVAIGNPEIRERLMKQYKARGVRLATLIHPNAVVGIHVKIGSGSILMAGAVVNPDTELGEGVIINTGATVDHDNRIADYAHVSVGAHLAGTVSVGMRTWIGAGAVVSNNIEICEDVMVGAGAAVVRNIEETGTYVGVPARKIK